MDTGKGSSNSSNSSSKVDPVHIVKAYRGSGGIAQLISNPGTDRDEPCSRQCLLVNIYMVGVGKVSKYDTDISINFFIEWSIKQYIRISDKLN
jgi:hypothetical protein